MDKTAPKAIGHIRVSTELQAADGTSVDAQRETLEDYYNAHKLNRIAVYQDDHTGKTLHRKGLQAAIERMKHSGALLVGVKLDRITRNADDFDYLLKNYFGEEPALPFVQAVRGQMPKLIESDGPTLIGQRPSKTSAEISTIAAGPNPFDLLSEVEEEKRNAEKLSPWWQKNFRRLLSLTAITFVVIVIWLLGSLSIKGRSTSSPQRPPDLAISIPDLADPPDLGSQPDMLPLAKKLKPRKNIPLKPQVPSQPPGRTKKVKAYVPPSL